MGVEYPVKVTKRVEMGQTWGIYKYLNFGVLN